MIEAVLRYYVRYSLHAFRPEHESFGLKAHRWLSIAGVIVGTGSERAAFALLVIAHIGLQYLTRYVRWKKFIRAKVQEFTSATEMKKS